MNASLPGKERPEPAKLPDPERRKLLCVDCAHHLVIDCGYFQPLAHVCKVEQMFDQVDGGPLYRKCSKARSDSNICGPYALRFEKQA